MYNKRVLIFILFYFIVIFNEAIFLALEMIFFLVYHLLFYLCFTGVFIVFFFSGLCFHVFICLVLLGGWAPIL
jgi:hypothetical protein